MLSQLLDFLSANLFANFYWQHSFTRDEITATTEYARKNTTSIVAIQYPLPMQFSDRIKPDSVLNAPW
jgi:hypothetical protein